MNGINLICASDECGKEFQQKTHNQKFCSDECCRIATNKRIMQKYYDKRDRRRGKVRLCEVCGETKLSRYNDTKTCAPCAAKGESQKNKAVLEMLTSVVL